MKIEDVKVGMWYYCKDGSAPTKAFMVKEDFSVYYGEYEPAKVAVHTPTEEEYNRLMEAYDKVGWRWISGDSIRTYNGWPTSKVRFQDFFTCAYDARYSRLNKADIHIITVDEAIESLKLQFPDKDVDGEIEAEEEDRFVYEMMLECSQSMEEAKKKVQQGHTGLEFKTVITDPQYEKPIMSLIKSHNPKPMGLVQKLKSLARSASEKRQDEYLFECTSDAEIRDFSNDGVNLILETLLEDKTFAEKIDAKLVKLEKADEKKK